MRTAGNRDEGADQLKHCSVKQLAKLADSMRGQLELCSHPV
jgi:hypothetical protein